MQLDSNLAAVTASLGPEHKMVISLKHQRQEMQHKLEDAIGAARASQTAAYIEMLRAAQESSQVALKGISDQINQAKQELGELTYQMSQYLTAKDEEKATHEQLDQVTKELDNMSQVEQQSEASGIMWAIHPEVPDTPSFPKLWITMTVAVFAGLMLSLGIAFLREWMDTSVRSPRDIDRIGEMNLLGIVPHEDDDPQVTGAPLPLVIFQAPHSMLAEQYRQVRSRLQHSTSLDSTRSILVTSPSPGDGKTTVACNLAAGLALNGRRILLVDANFRRPELHRIFSIANETGFSAALSNLESFPSSVCQTQVPNLDVMPAGPRPPNGTELLESQLLSDFIERALEEYDHVIFDSGPLLFVSESMAMAPRVDGVVSVVRARTNSRGLLQRMRDALRQVHAEHVGVVLNAVRSQAGGYYNRNIKTYYAYSNYEA
jgi:capsular exopolysaccharide synthesis family protein